MLEPIEEGIFFPVRRPTRGEKIACGRDFGPDCGVEDLVLLAHGDDSGRAALADALKRNGFYDAAHVVPGGIYLEERPWVPDGIDLRSVYSEERP